MSKLSPFKKPAEEPMKLSLLKTKLVRLFLSRSVLRNRQKLKVFLCL